ncbi:hypothetical protein CHRYSEO8AT_270038 [Chryseobacterium sp. 8AT]|nr:hypothetical protein CHRYSEO8AT_270038 [Chryseobacterium sp. 8AT]
MFHWCFHNDAFWFIAISELDKDFLFGDNQKSASMSIFIFSSLNLSLSK